jgi:hypothetical protein
MIFGLLLIVSMLLLVGALMTKARRAVLDAD